MTQNEIIDKINDTIDKAVTRMNSNMPSLEKKIFSEIQSLAKGLDYKNGRVSTSAKNIRVISAINKKLRRIILTSGYLEDAKEFLKAFNTVTSLQNQYMAAVTEDFNYSAVLKSIKFQAVADTAVSLTEEGLNVNVINKLRAILQKNVSTGGTFEELLEQARAATIATPAGPGILDRYVKTITVDALNQYSRNYLQVATAGSSTEWYQYTGSIIENSREFCKAMVKKRFFNIKEIPDLLKGNFPEFEKEDGRINPKTGLPEGMIEGTNEANFLTFLGGYTCGHRAIPVQESIIPKSVINKFKDAYQ